MIRANNQEYFIAFTNLFFKGWSVSIPSAEHYFNGYLF
jgi:hypothetical protein